MRAATAFMFFFALLAGRVMALNFSVSGVPNNVTLSNLTLANDQQLDSLCTTFCSQANANISACGTNDACLCGAGTAAAVASCQQCFFTDLIDENRAIANVLAGSSPALAAYSAQCVSLGQPKPVVALTLPASWDGPVAMHLSTGGTVVYLVAVLTLGVGLISVILTM